MDEKNFTILYRYMPGEYVFGAEQVAREIAYRESSDDLWTDVQDDDSEHKVISWNSKHGDRVERIDVFSPWKRETEDDVNIYMAGRKDGRFNVSQAVDWMIDTCQIFPDEKGVQIREITHRIDQIISSGEYWSTVHIGQKIIKRPRIRRTLLTRFELQAFEGKCLAGQWPDHLVQLGFKEPLRPSGLIPVNKNIRKDSPTYDSVKGKYRGLWGQVMKLAQIYYARCNDFTQAI